MILPYEGEFASYQPLRRITESEKVQQLLRRSKIREAGDPKKDSLPDPIHLPDTTNVLPRYVLAIDGSNAEIPIRNGYPGARVGYCTVASVLIDMDMVSRLDETRPIDPVQFRETEKAASIDAAFPGTNVVTRRQHSSRASFREELYDHFAGAVFDEDDRQSLLNTFEALLQMKPKARTEKCPYSESEGCTASFHVPLGSTSCPSCGRPVFSTDALRIHERFNDLGSNGEAFGLVMQVWERTLVIHLLRCLEQRDLLKHAGRIAFFVDGPLAVFGPPAWLSAAISAELKRINGEVRKNTGSDLLILGIEKSGEFVDHFTEIDETETPGEALFKPRDYLLLTDGYIKKRIQQSDSSKRYGLDTYFGRKFFYKTAGGARIVGNLPFLTEAQDTIETADAGSYPQFSRYCDLLDKLASSRFSNALSPLISAHAQAAIPLHLGGKVLRQLAQALMGNPGR